MTAVERGWRTGKPVSRRWGEDLSGVDLAELAPYDAEVEFNFFTWELKEAVLWSDR